MRTAYRNRMIYYIASLDTEKGTDDYGKPQYSVPFVFRENLAPVNSESDIAEYGNRIKNMYKSLVDRSKWEGRIKPLDLAYLDGAMPADEKVNGAKANYKVESIRKTLNTITIYFEKLP